MCKSTLYLSYPLKDQIGEFPMRDNLATKTTSGKNVSADDTRQGRAKSSVGPNDTGYRKSSSLYMTVNGVTVECSSCGVKLGRFSEVESPCSCGIMVPGPALRINAAKV